MYQEFELYNNLCVVFLIILVIMNAKFVFSNSTKKGTSYVVLWMFITLFSLFYRVGFDFEGHQLLLESYLQTGEARHMEPFYYEIIEYIPQDYMAWRFCIWGAAAALMLFSMKKVGCRSEYATLLFLSVCLIPCFYYLRNSLAFAVLYLGTVFVFSSPKLYSKDLLIGVILIYFSFFLHKSSILYIVIIVLAFIFPLKKIVLISSLLLFPLFYKLIGTMSASFLNLDFLLEGTIEMGEYYMSEINRFTINTNGIISLIVHSFPFVFIVLAVIWKQSATSKKDISNLSKVFLIVTYITMYLSFLLMGNFSNQLYRRLWNTSMFPLVIFLASYYADATKRKGKEHKIFFYSLLFMYTWDFVYALL